MDKGPIFIVPLFCYIYININTMHTVLLILAGLGIRYLIDKVFDLYIKWKGDGE